MTVSSWSDEQSALLAIKDKQFSYTPRFCNLVWVHGGRSAARVRPRSAQPPPAQPITPDRQRAFIAALPATGIVTQAAREIGASLEALYKLRNRPGAEGFRTAW